MLVSIDTTDIYGLNRIADVLYKQKKYEEELEYYEKALAIDPVNVNALNGKAFALQKLQRYDEAIKVL